MSRNCTAVVNSCLDVAATYYTISRSYGGAGGISNSIYAFLVVWNRIRISNSFGYVSVHIVKSPVVWFFSFNFARFVCVSVIGASGMVEWVAVKTSLRACAGTSSVFSFGFGR